MQHDLHMSDTEWSAGISMFYVGYIISQVPANVILAKGNPRILLPCAMLAWPAVTICMTALNSAWGFMLCRFLVGVTEGPFVPAVSLMTSSWYTKRESPLRMGIWHAGNTISNVISGLLAAAILTNMSGVRGLASWQWFVLIEGSVSILVGLVSFWLIPKFPSTTGTYFLTPEEKEMAQYRQEVNAGGVSEDDEGGYWSGVRLALGDPFTYLFAVSHFFIIIAQSYKDFFPSILKTFGFSKTNTYLLQAPPYLFAYIVTLTISWSSGRFLEHCWHGGQHGHVPDGRRHHDLDARDGAALLQPLPALRRALRGAQPADRVGDVGGAAAAHQARRPHRHRQLRQQRQPLVHALLLPAQPGAALRDGRRPHHRRLRPVHHLVRRHPLVLPAQEPRARKARGRDGRCQQLALRHLRCQCEA